MAKHILYQLVPLKKKKKKKMQLIFEYEFEYLQFCACTFTEPPYQCELSGQTGFYQFLLVAGPQPDTYLAYPVRSLSDISVAPFHDIAVKEMQGLYNQVTKCSVIDFIISMTLIFD